MKPELSSRIELGAGISALLQGKTISIKGPRGEARRMLTVPSVKVSVEGSAIVLSAKNATKREKRGINTLAAHVQNLIKGVQQPWVFRLRVCSSHFPMNISVAGNELVVKNLVGEKVPRVLKLKEGVAVKVSGQDITVESCDIERAGQTAGDIEQLARIVRVDRRVFQDGIYVVEKCGVKVE